MALILVVGPKIRALLHFFFAGFATMKGEEKSRSAGRTWEFGKQFGVVQNRLEALKVSSGPFLFTGSRQYPHDLQ